MDINDPDFPGIPYYGMDGKRIPFLEWVKLYENGDGRVVQQTRGSVFFISTVLLGIDHNHLRYIDKSAKPIIFETMVFTRGGNALEFQERYSTLEEAKAGHAAALKQFTGKRAFEKLRRYCKQRKQLQRGPKEPKIIPDPKSPFYDLLSAARRAKLGPMKRPRVRHRA